MREVVTDKGEISSARLINIVGAVTGTMLLLYHGLWLDNLSGEVLGVYLAYCSGTYGIGKYMDRRYRNVEYDDGYKASGDSGTSGSMHKPGDIEG